MRFAAAVGRAAFTPKELENPIICDAIDWYLDEVDRAKFEERKAASKQILLLDAIGSMIAPTLLKDGQKIAKVGLLAYLESQRTARNVITVDPKKLPNPDEMTFV